MSKKKSFGYPIPLTDLEKFLCPDQGKAVEHDGLSYFMSEWWTLRTAQGTGADIVEESPLSLTQQYAFDRLEAIPERSWRSLEEKSSLINRYGAAIWERTHLRHHIRTSPIVRVGFSYALRGVLQLCTQLPNAVICTEGGNSDPVMIKFTKGSIVLNVLPWREDTDVSLNLWTKS